MIDVVIVTILRSSLKKSLKAINAVIPDPRIILITGFEGNMGDLRNKGLFQCTSKYTCFIDDDVIVNRTWFQKCMERLKMDDVILVAGYIPEGIPDGNMICKTQPFKDVGGFPRLESLMWKKLGNRIVGLPDAVCEHLGGRGFNPFFHQFIWATHGFQTETKLGYGRNPKDVMQQTLLQLWRKHPEEAIAQPIYLVKDLFVWPFFIGKKLKRK